MTIEGVHLRTLADLVDFICGRVTDPATMGDSAQTAIGAGTANAFVRRLRSSQRALADLIRGDVRTGRPNDHAANKQVTVVDLHNLMERAQRFVTGVVLVTEDRHARRPPDRAACCSPCSTS